MKKFLLPSENDATTLVVEMSQIIDRQGHITVGQVHDLLGLPHQFVDELNGWFATNHVLNPAGDNTVSLEFPDPVAIRNNGRSTGTIRLTMEFDANELTERRLTDFLNATELTKDATAWSLTRRPRGPRVSYRSPVTYGDDI